MKIAIVNPEKHFLFHRVRGTGFYIRNLENSLQKFDKNNSYFSCTSNSIPRGVDIIHYPYFEPFFLTLPLFEKRKIVVTVHDLIPLVFPKNFPKGLKGKLRWEIQKILLKKTNAVITDSRNSKNDIIKYTGLKGEKIHSIYLAAGDQFGKMSSEKVKQTINKFNLPERFILYVGDVTWNKNLPTLIEAVNLSNLPLVMVGKALVDENFDRKNPWNKDLARVIDLAKNNDRIKRIGFVSDSDLVSLYNAATVFAMPSIYEGFGLPILEAMSSGSPVVTSRGGSIPEIAGDAAFYVNPNDPNNMAEGLKKVFQNEKIRSELRKKGFDQVKKFSWEKTARQTIEVYKSIL